MHCTRGINSVVGLLSFVVEQGPSLRHKDSRGLTCYLGVAVTVKGSVDKVAGCH